MPSWADSPEGWTPSAAPPPPDLAASPRVTIVEWTAMRAPSDGARLVRACFDAPIDGWSPELDPIALERIDAMATSTALRIRGDATLAVSASGRAGRDGALATHRLSGRGAEARTWVGVVARDSGDGERFAARACMRVCATRGSDAADAGDDAEPTCARAVEGGAPDGRFVPPPPPATWLRATLAAIHHPRATALGGAALACAIGAVAVLTRARPRSRRAPRRR